jgi:adenine-specific DNA-methyltransferase
MSQKYEKLKKLLMELFQLDQPDLDFGLYRIMHAKSAEVTQFLDKDLLPQVKEAFGQYKSADKAEIEKELSKAIEQAKALDVDPEATPKVKELRARLATDSVDLNALESEVYDHLFSFFRRYYDEGDFLAKRVYKPGVYAIPYEGEEVTLHWANKDQYYIKTSEYLRDYAFRLRPDDEKNPMRVHFRLVDAVEGEHGNVKPAEGKDRVFILGPAGESGHDFIAEEQGEQAKELAIRFEYRPATLTDWPEDVRAGKNKPPTQKELSALAVQRVLAVTDVSLARWITELQKPQTLSGGEKADYPRLEAHLRRYTARNTFDYFIHKDLGGFLRRELDFYIKNEVMHLDDVENETAPRVEQYLSKIKVIRRIAGKIIDFLAQLEDFQKRLWLKKKFVVGTTYCVTVGSIPERFHLEIAGNERQRQEWVRLFQIDTPDTDLLTPPYSVPLSAAFVSAHPTLTVDTALFGDDFTSRLLDTLGNIEELDSGLLFHSENSQALSLMQARYRDKVQCIYIDPPYNTDAGPISYKNGYRRSSWVAMIFERISLGRSLLRAEGVLTATIDDYQFRELDFVVDEIFGGGNRAGTVVIRSNPSGRPVPQGFAQSHEYALFAKRSSAAEISKLPRTERQSARYRHEDSGGNFMWELLRKRGSDSERSDRRSLYYPIYAVGEDVRVPEMTFDDDSEIWNVHEEPRHDEVAVYPIDEAGTERRWRSAPEAIRSEPTNFKAKTEDGVITIYYKFRPGVDGVLPLTNWIDAKYSATEYGTGVLKRFFTEYDVFSYPKSIHAVEDCLRIAGLGPSSIALDYFAGSGTTAHAVINLNREDGGRRRFVVVEMESYFDRVLLPRIKKVTFSPEWRDGSPARAATPDDARRSPRVIKVIRLESYEDAINNLETRRTDDQQRLLESADSKGADGLKEQYLLRYMLNVETQGSQSLLNIQAFTDPTAYKLKVKRPGSDESREVNVDLIETFNWLVGLTVRHFAAPQTLSASFERDSEKRLRVKGSIKQQDRGRYWFRTVTGTTPEGRKTLIIWRKLTGNPEEDNLVLDEWFKKQGYSSKDSEFDLIYVNGTNNLENLKTPDDTWKVRLIEEDFHRLMFEAEGA